MENCSLCLESFDSDELIEVEDGLVKLREGFAKFTDIISDVFSSNVDHLAAICVSCKEKIINFYNFKQKVKINLYQSREDEQTNEIVEEVKEFLSATNEKMIVMKHESSLSIVAASTLKMSDVQESMQDNSKAWQQDENLFMTISSEENEAVGTATLESISEQILDTEELLMERNDLVSILTNREAKTQLKRQQTDEATGSSSRQLRKKLKL